MPLVLFRLLYLVADHRYLKNTNILGTLCSIGLSFIFKNLILLKFLCHCLCSGNAMAKEVAVELEYRAFDSSKLPNAYRMKIHNKVILQVFINLL